LLPSGHRQRLRQRPLRLSDMMTLMVSFQARHSRAFQHSSTEDVEGQRRPSCPALVSESRLVPLLPRARGPRCHSLPTRPGRCPGSTFVDATPLALCQHQRLGRHPVFQEWATRGTGSRGWYVGFPLQRRGNDEGELLGCRVPAGEGDDREPVERRAPGLWGHLDGTRGDLSKARPDALGATGVKVSTLLRRTRQPRLMRLGARLRLSKRCVIATVHDQLQSSSQIDHARPRRLTGVMVHLVGGLLAYPCQPKKPSLGLRFDAAGLPVVI
jgi:Transposase DDE domain